jgi:hypothetical protein
MTFTLPPTLSSAVTQTLDEWAGAGKDSPAVAARRVDLDW